jgi:di/tricarboxylate transporter
MRMANVTGLPIVYDSASVVTETLMAELAQSPIVGFGLTLALTDAVSSTAAVAAIFAFAVAVSLAVEPAWGFTVGVFGAGSAVHARSAIAMGTSTITSATIWRRRYTAADSRLPTRET